jgi:Na+-driven multidrug efflux pump
LMMSMMAGTLANILLAPFLIFRSFRFLGMDWTGAGWGVGGAGLATAAANFLTAAMVYSLFFRKRSLLALRFWPQWRDRTGLWDAFSVAMPSILSQSLIGINLFILTRLAAPFGPAAVSAIGIGSRLESLAVFPSLAIMVAVLSLVGQNFGAKRFDRVEQSVRIGLATAFFTLTTIGLLVHFFRAPLLAYFHPDPLALPSAYHFLGLTSLGFGFVGISIVSSGAFQGLGRGLPFLFLNTLRMVVFAAPLGYMLARFQGEFGLHYAPLIASGATSLLASAWILGAVKRLRKAPYPSPAPIPVPT